MPNFTTNLNLEKPLVNENYNIEVFNNNAEKIDTAINEVNSKIGDMGRLPTYETDIVGAIDEVNRNKQNEIAQELKTESKWIVGAINEVSSQLDTVVPQTTKDITYYVNSVSGSDSNNGLTISTAFKTIGYAIGKLPQVINHAVKINVAQGTYNESVSISGFLGRGYIELIGGTSTSNIQYKVNHITVKDTTINITVRGFDITGVTSSSLTLVNCSLVILEYINSTTVSSYGVSATNSMCKVENSSFSNKTYAIQSNTLSTVYSNNNTGASNSGGLAAVHGATIIKNGTQPPGGNAEVIQTGGLIR